MNSNIQLVEFAPFNKHEDSCLICFSPIQKYTRIQLECIHSLYFCKPCIIQWYLKKLKNTPFLETTDQSLLVIECPLQCVETTHVSEIFISLKDYYRISKLLSDKEEKILWKYHLTHFTILKQFDKQVISSIILILIMISIIVVMVRQAIQTQNT